MECIWLCSKTLRIKGLVVIQTNNKIKSFTPICMRYDILGCAEVILMPNIEIEMHDSENLIKKFKQ